MANFTLADDDDKFLFLMHHLLLTSFPGCSIASFSNAEDALAHVLDVGTEVVITDHTMGSVTGTELIRNLRRHNNSLPIIMVSGDAAAEIEAREAGANLFLHKDVALKQLPREVVRLLHA